MQDEIAQLRETMARLDQLLVRYELDIAARLHVVDYQATIRQLCDNFDKVMRRLVSPTSPQ